MESKWYKYRSIKIGNLPPDIAEVRNSDINNRIVDSVGMVHNGIGDCDLWNHVLVMTQMAEGVGPVFCNTWMCESCLIGISLRNYRVYIKGSRGIMFVAATEYQKGHNTLREFLPRKISGLQVEDTWEQVRIVSPVMEEHKEEVQQDDKQEGKRQEGELEEKLWEVGEEKEEEVEEFLVTLVRQRSLGRCEEGRLSPPTQEHEGLHSVPDGVHAQEHQAPTQGRSRPSAAVLRLWNGWTVRWTTGCNTSRCDPPNSWN
ncbi:uncharacterized protein LOC143030450 [Oratosquilla oratoria]|uniref:uncharacterized protein LOC143030450 n=1 Tax=Oratosquilla oratoria TaxID=337810 RepID=UPI003F773922